MLFWMYGASRDFSLGLTFSDWISAGKMPPTTTETTRSDTTLMIGIRQDFVHSTERKARAQRNEATARMVLVGRTTVASVYWMPVMRSVFVVSE